MLDEARDRKARALAEFARVPGNPWVFSGMKKASQQCQSPVALADACQRRLREGQISGNRRLVATPHNTMTLYHTISRKVRKTVSQHTTVS